MKMEHTLYAPTDGVVESVAVSVGQQVNTGMTLAVITPPTEGAS
jgi:propionyl-CoA carboxylase alpha chain